MQNSLQFSPELNRDSKTLSLLTTVLALILVDQLTKTLAFSFAPAVRYASTQPDWFMGLAWHIHEPNAYSTFSALFAFGLVTFACFLPISKTVKILWVAAALTNHVEMLMRPGTVDFLAFKLSNTVFIANVADLYFAVGVVILAVGMAKQIRSAKSWMEPVTA